MSNMVYSPPKSLEGFLTSESFVSLVSGPVGSGKSSAAMIKVAYHAARMRKQKDGVRRSRAVIVRNTNQMLTDATIPTFMTWFPDGVAGHYARTDKRFMLKFDDVECDVMFRGLDDANDVRRLLSVEASFGVLDEYRELHPDIFNALQGRVGRYPSKAVGGCVTDEGKPNHHIWGATNAPDADTFWEDYMSNPPTTAKIFKQPSALSPECDWSDNLIEGYYTTLAEGKTPDWVSVYIHNKFGRTLSGQPVWRCFDRDVHVAKEELKSNAPNLVIGVDAGLNPTAVLTEMTYDGRVLVLDALTGLEGGMSALRFCREMLRPLISSKYPMKTVGIAIDPAAFQRVQTDERSVADIFRQEGFHVMAPVDRSNTLSPRLSVVEKYLTMTVNGNAGMLVSPQCKGLISAMGGKYRYKINTKGETDDKPDKNHPFSDYADALQYACLHHDKGSISGRQVGASYQVPEKVNMSAWT